MAAPTTSADVPRSTSSMKEDLLDVITNISPSDTPFSSLCKTGKADSTYHEWLKDALPTRGSKATIEGADASYDDMTAPTRAYNYVEQIETNWSVSDVANATSHAGMTNLIAYEILRQSKVWKNALEYDVINGSRTAFSEGATAAVMGGVLEFVSTNTISGGATAADILTEDMYNALGQTIWEAGGNPTHTFVAGWLKRKISNFTTGVQKNMQSSDKRFVNVISIYESDFGVQEIMLCRDMPHAANNATLLMGQMDLCSIDYLINPHKEDRAKTGSATKGVIIGACTFVIKEEKAFGKITGLSTTK